MIILNKEHPLPDELNFLMDVDFPKLEVHKIEKKILILDAKYELWKNDFINNFSKKYELVSHKHTISCERVSKKGTIEKSTHTIYSPYYIIDGKKYSVDNLTYLLNIYLSGLISKIPTIRGNIDDILHNISNFQLCPSDMIQLFGEKYFSIIDTLSDRNLHYIQIINNYDGSNVPENIMKNIVSKIDPIVLKRFLDMNYKNLSDKQIMLIKKNINIQNYIPIISEKDIQLNSPVLEILGFPIPDLKTQYTMFKIPFDQIFEKLKNNNFLDLKSWDSKSLRKILKESLQSKRYYFPKSLYLQNLDFGKIIRYYPELNEGYIYLKNYPKDDIFFSTKNIENTSQKIEEGDLILITQIVKTPIGPKAPSWILLPKNI